MIYVRQNCPTTRGPHKMSIEGYWHMVEHDGNQHKLIGGDEYTWEVVQIARWALVDEEAIKHGAWVDVALGAAMSDLIGGVRYFGR